ncbi:MAG: alpha-ribazole phosphatase [Anaerolineales bacterium]|nr:alpha-ribazole phosphatase [Anaerolineales bacterium]
MKLLLVRHGQTDWNVAQRFQGQGDVPLNGIGRQQANALADRLSAQPIDLVYASDLQRALETANVIVRRSGCQPNLHLDSRLREMNFGVWEGLTYKEIKQSDPAALAAWKADVSTTAAPNGETLNQLSARVQSFLDDLRAQHADKTILIVTHGGVLQTLLCSALNLKPTMYWQFHLSPASLSEIAFYPAGAIINLMNDTSHLSPLPKGEG